MFVTRMLEQPASETLVHNIMAIHECHHADADKQRMLVLSCQPRVTVTSCFVYNVIRDLESIDHLTYLSYTQERINTQVIYRFAYAQVKCAR